ncbi:precorrin-6A reductase [Rhizobium subbaraonis]|uniref:Precorrin-6A reductase n=2 Tax=Rhizobium subbaraonis TaxID=908946 RepID=A0A285U755_9HYPH|nr:precorrin-6A reductase [Rhizobium subbaraonis]
MRILILGGTAEARELAERLAPRDALQVTLSLAGRTLDPAPQPAPTRTGGFGGVQGLRDYLRLNRIDLLVDATHPFARRISANAERAAVMSDTPLIRLQRAGWRPVEGDRWTRVPTLTDAVAALGAEPSRIFLAIGRQEAHHFNTAAHHSYFVRSVDPVDPPLTVPDATYILARGPFAVEDEIDLLRHHRIDAIVSKNSGGEATYAKIAAARALGLPVVMVERTGSNDVPVAETVDAALALVDHVASAGRKRGV